MTKYFITAVFLFSVIFSAYTQSADNLVDKGYEEYDKENYSAAIAYFNQAEEINDTNPELYYLRGVCKSLLNDNEEALNDFDRALALKPDYPEVFYEIGYSHFILNNLEKAVLNFTKAIKLNPSYAEAYLNRGTIYCMIDKKTEAQNDYEKAKDLGFPVPFTDCK